MPDTRRDLFSLSTRMDPLAATVRENINSIRLRFAMRDVPFTRETIRAKGQPESRSRREQVNNFSSSDE